MAGIAQAIYQQVTLTNSPESIHTTFTTVLIRCLSLNRTLFQRNAVYLTSIFVGAFAFEVAFDTASNKIWDTMNRGRQWKDIRHQYIQTAGEDEDEE
ncbi:hypothetical protein DPV78_008422 [Talaromyces pinophilus]|nr:hypothetical protein DPV78_008422 [Talaromyces pinophilus]